MFSRRWGIDVCSLVGSPYWHHQRSVRTYYMYVQLVIAIHCKRGTCEKGNFCNWDCQFEENVSQCITCWVSAIAAGLVAQDNYLITSLLHGAPPPRSFACVSAWHSERGGEKAGIGFALVGASSPLLSKTSFSLHSHYLEVVGREGGRAVGWTETAPTRQYSFRSLSLSPRQRCGKSWHERFFIIFP